MKYLVALSLLLQPIVAFAIECPNDSLKERTYGRWFLDCDRRLPRISEEGRERIKQAVELNPLQAPVAGASQEWKRYVRSSFQPLPPELQRWAVMDYRLCLDYKQNRICHDQWEGREDLRCMAVRSGDMGIDFPAGAQVDIHAETSQNVPFVGETRQLPTEADITVSGDLKRMDGIVYWNLGNSEAGDATITMPKSAGRYTIYFAKLRTSVRNPQNHSIDYENGSGPPLRRPNYRVETDFTIDWRCPDR